MRNDAGRPGGRKKGWRGARAPVVAAGLVAALLVGGVSVALGPLPAYADVASAPYAITAPTSAVSEVVASPGVVVQGSPASFEVRFKVTVALSGSQPGTWVSVVPSSPLGSVPVGVEIVDLSASTCSRAGTNGGALSGSVVTVDLAPSCSMAAGDDVEVGFSTKVPSTARSFYFSVTTSANPAPAASGAVMVSSSPPAFSATSQALGANATYMVSDASWSSMTLSQSFTVVVLSAGATAGVALSWGQSAAGYSVTVTSPSGGATRDAVQAATLGETPGPHVVTLVLANPVASGYSLSISAEGTNPGTTSTDQVSVQPEVFVSGGYLPVGPVETTNPVLFGTSVANVTAVPSPPLAGAQATYTVGFEATTAVAGGPGASICLGEMAGPTNFATETSELVTDSSAGWHFVAQGTSYPAGNPPANPGCDAFDNGAVIPVPFGYDIRAGDTLVVVLLNVTNPPAGTVSDFAVSTSSDTLAARAAPFGVEASTAPGPLVSVSPATTGALATYTVSDLVAGADMTGGSTEITVEGPPGTAFPNNPAYYTIEDLTSPSGSASVSAPVSGGGTSTVAIVVPADVHQDDHLVLTVQDAVNPASAGGDYTLSLLGPLVGSRRLAPFPHANLAYPNGAIVDFSGTDYVFAGGHAFGIPSPSALEAVEAVDHAEPQTAAGGATPPTGPLRPGTLVFTRPVNGDPTIYVAGSDGDLHGFASPAQFLAGGYDTALVVTVPNLVGTGVGAPAGQLGTAATALSTRSDGALVGSGGKWYVFAGGRALPVPGTSLAGIRRRDPAVPLYGQVTPAQLSTTMANGVLLSTSGRVYVSYEGELWLFKSEAQLVSDGYGGTPAVPSAGAGSLPVSGPYGGS
jgi:hypothetical protein